ncbi:MAG: hypothetical protein UV74_C0013G0153 [Candidatus Woesebacteria bacterium GW2011_GWB1_43_14]|uniref:Uncharacterized protein n=1 Tax=Candidatus Woesebacteria bacterium GW2011_GWB1_43_14 TaxID=1618578 RepID=A0A0G1FPS5_9BACT|nr:MAG: hypothetical protein UV51_C0005G0068 [Candidatus Woesebacteria bacterium GW2011_GWC1_42_9]KKS97031.1 MAG: hypothetical protein UV74_C0013G0153 [Candidatus Woesebacteria bacterium GW2011_GWB1_43_14]
MEKSRLIDSILENSQPVTDSAESGQHPDYDDWSEYSDGPYWGDGDHWADSTYDPP